MKRKLNTTNLLLSGIVILLIVVLILILTGVINVKKNVKKAINTANKKLNSVDNKFQNQMKEMEKESGYKQNYIKPAEFQVGLTQPPNPYKSANLCNDKVLYPINGLGVDYESKSPSMKCPCTQFIQPP
jgi:hypothetical protein